MPAAKPFKPDWLNQMPATEVLQVALSLLMHQKVPGWPGATDEQLEQVAKGIVGCLASHGHMIVRFDPQELAEIAATNDAMR